MTPLQEIEALVDDVYDHLFQAAIVDYGGTGWRDDCDRAEVAYGEVKAKLLEAIQAQTLMQARLLTARATAYALARCYVDDTRPPKGVVDDALSWKDDAVTLPASRTPKLPPRSAAE